MPGIDDLNARFAQDHYATNRQRPFLPISDFIFEQLALLYDALDATTLASAIPVSA
jgi:hypothetical protein